MSDAGHNFADALALAFSWYGVWIARKPSTSKRTFGYHRVGILAALVNAVSLVVIKLNCKGWPARPFCTSLWTTDLDWAPM